MSLDITPIRNTQRRKHKSGIDWFYLDSYIIIENRILLELFNVIRYANDGEIT